MQAQVQPGRGTRGGEDLPVVDVEDAGVYLDVRVCGGQQVGRGPVGGGTQAAEQSGGGQREGARTDGSDAGAVGGGGREGVVDGR